jgi:hypothetical protein
MSSWKVSVCGGMAIGENSHNERGLTVSQTGAKLPGIASSH